MEHLVTGLVHLRTQFGNCYLNQIHDVVNVIKGRLFALNMDGNTCQLSWPFRLVFSGFLENCAVKDSKVHLAQ